MPAVRSPTLWLSVAATVISSVTVAAMASSGAPRRPLTFAGAILVPDSRYSAAFPTAGATAQLSRPSTRRVAARRSTAVSAPLNGHQPPVAAIQAHNVPAAPSASAAPDTSAAPVPSGAPAQTAPPSARSVRTPASSSSRSSAGPPTSAPTTPASAPNPAALAQTLFIALNDARKQAGRPSLSWNPGLQRSAAGHDQAMAGADQLASQVGGEPVLAVREANQGVVASFSAESLGYAEGTGLAAAIAVEQQMLAELPPNDARRQTLLSTAVDAIRIDVLLDPAHGRVWVTEDFAKLA